MKKNITLIALIALVGLSAFAQTESAPAIPAELPMIKSLALLKVFAIDRGHEATLFMSSSGQVPNRGTSIGVVNNGHEKADDLLARLSSQPVQFTVASPQDEVSLSVNVVDVNGGPLFSGNKNFRFFVGKGGGAALPGDWVSDFVALKRSVRIPFPGVKHVEVVVRNAKGEILTNPGVNTVENVGFDYPTNLTARAGEVKITYGDGKGAERTRVYNLATGMVVPPSDLASFSGPVPSRIQGLWYWSRGATNLTASGMRKDDVIRLDLDVPSSVYFRKFTFEDGSQPRAIVVGFTVAPENGMQFVRIPYDDGAMRQASFTPGAHFIFFETEEDQFREITFDWYDGGKG